MAEHIEPATVDPIGYIHSVLESCAHLVKNIIWPNLKIFTDGQQFLTAKALNGIQWEVAHPLTLNYEAPIIT